MIAPKVSISRRPHRVSLQNPGDPVPDGDGGYTEGMTPLNPPQMFASIEPATAQNLERDFAGTVVATATHVVTMPYHPGVTLETELVFKGRTFSVIGKANREERDRELVLLCAEQVA